MGKKSESVGFHPEVLTFSQRKVLQQLGPFMTQRKFYLGGGTALSIYFGHRHSVDLDWFHAEAITDSLLMAQDIRDQGILFGTGQIERGTLRGTISGVRVSILEYRYPLLKPLVSWPKFECSMASLEDLACMKLSALAQRGAKKDFVDIYALGSRHISLKEMIELYQEKYRVKDIGHVLYGLTYFDDADQERMPGMKWKIDWRTIKRTIQTWMKEMAGCKKL